MRYKWTNVKCVIPILPHKSSIPVVNGYKSIRFPASCTSLMVGHYFLLLDLHGFGNNILRFTFFFPIVIFVNANKIPSKTWFFSLNRIIIMQIIPIIVDCHIIAIALLRLYINAVYLPKVTTALGSIIIVLLITVVLYA